jgi:predicted Zn-dependent protease with MMP-like domain
MPLLMPRRFDHPPTLDEIEAIARAALAGLPALFAAHLEGVVLQVEELADEALLADLGIDHPLDLTGVYEGIPIGERSVGHSGTMPDRIRLFRRAILDEWIEGDEALEHLVGHVLIHEVGHHFGFSDDAMHQLEEQA